MAEQRCEIRQKYRRTIVGNRQMCSLKWGRNTVWNGAETQSEMGQKHSVIYGTTTNWKYDRTTIINATELVYSRKWDITTIWNTTVIGYGHSKTSAASLKFDRTAPWTSTGPHTEIRQDHTLKFNRITSWNSDSDSDSDSLFTKFYNKESVSKAVSIQT